MIIFLLLLPFIFRYEFKEFFTNQCGFIPYGIDVDQCVEVCTSKNNQSWGGESCDKKSCENLCKYCENPNLCKWLNNDYKSNKSDNEKLKKEYITDEILDAEVDSEPKIDMLNYSDSNKHVEPSLSYINYYKNDLTNKAKVVDNSLKNLLKTRNDVMLYNKPMTSFDSLNFNRAFIDSLKIQGLDDKYIYKLYQQL